MLLSQANMHVWAHKIKALARYETFVNEELGYSAGNLRMHDWGGNNFANENYSHTKYFIGIRERKREREFYLLLDYNIMDTYFS